MTTTPQYYDITINGQPARARKATDGQTVAIANVNNPAFGLEEKEQLGIVMDVFASMLETQEDRTLLLRALAGGTYTIQDFVATIQRIGTAPADTATGDRAAAAKRTAKRTAAKKTVSGRKRPVT